MLTEIICRNTKNKFASAEKYVILCVDKARANKQGDGKMLTLKKMIIFSVVTIFLVLASVQAVKMSRQLERDFADSIRTMQGDK